MRWAVFFVALLPGARRGAICLSRALRRGADGLESHDPSLVPIKRLVWSDRGVGRSLSFLAGFAGCPIVKSCFSGLKRPHRWQSVALGSISWPTVALRRIRVAKNALPHHPAEALRATAAKD